MLLARRKQNVITAVDKYVKDSVLFPPGQWDLDYLKPATEEITQLSAQRHVRRTQAVKTPPRKRRKSYAIQQPLIPAVENLQPSQKTFSALPLRRDTTVSADDIVSFLKGKYFKVQKTANLTKLLKSKPTVLSFNIFEIYNNWIYRMPQVYSIKKCLCHQLVYTLFFRYK